MRTAALVVLAALAAGPAAASGMAPCRAFTSPDGRLYSIGEAYAASDLVAIGKVEAGSSVTLTIAKTLKGRAPRKKIPLTVSHCHGTACGGGFSVAPGVDLLFLLKRLPDGVYDGVTGNGNFTCPTVFEVKDGAALLDGKRVPVELLKRYLESKPEPISLYR